METTFKLTWRGMEADMALIADLLGDALDPPAEAVSLRQAIKDGDLHPTDWLAEAYFAETPDMEAVSTLLSLTIPEAPDWAKPEQEELAEDDWVKFALGSLGPVEAGRFFLHGQHDRDQIPDDPDRIPIEIEANQAFGTGHHPTTAGCLMLLDRLAGIAPDKILDLGCGSAILAIAAAKLWGRKIIASDIDKKSVEIAKENAALNGVDDKTHVIESDGFDHEDIGNHGPYDFVFANILAGPLQELAPHMATHVALHGRVMLAGLMAEQEAAVCKAYEFAGFHQINRLDHPTWPILLFVRRNHSA